MKRSNYTTLWILALLIANSSVMAQSAYTLSGNTNWSAVLPSTCYACTITIPSGATLTVNESATCQNCTFDGGTLSISSETLNIQYAGSQTTTFFNGTNLEASGIWLGLSLMRRFRSTIPFFTFFIIVPP